MVTVKPNIALADLGKIEARAGRFRAPVLDSVGEAGSGRSESRPIWE